MLRQRISRPVQTAFCSCGNCGRMFLVLPTSTAQARADMLRAVSPEISPTCDCWLWHGLSLEWVKGQWPKQVIF